MDEKKSYTTRLEGNREKEIDLFANFFTGQPPINNEEENTSNKCYSFKSNIIDHEKLSSLYAS